MIRLTRRNRGTGNDGEGTLRLPVGAAKATITVQPLKVYLTPHDRTLLTRQSEEFTVTVLDGANPVVSGLQYTWSCTAGGPVPGSLTVASGAPFVTPFTTTVPRATFTAATTNTGPAEIVCKVERREEIGSAWKELATVRSDVLVNARRRGWIRSFIRYDDTGREYWGTGVEFERVPGAASYEIYMYGYNDFTGHYATMPYTLSTSGNTTWPVSENNGFCELTGGSGQDARAWGESRFAGGTFEVTP